jgi:class 3 adenylate cyclase
MSAALAGEERKVVSVLFVDLVGFTARSDRADPEDVRATLRLYHEVLRREIERWAGTVEKFIGDAVMAVFGAPLAHEDDAERAVRAALRILDAIAELNEQRPGLDLAIRGAVNTGEAVVALGARPEAGEGFVTGDVVNVASRLQSIAPVGGVVVGELTYRATRDRIVYVELEPTLVKGKEEAVPIWRAVEARSRFGVDIEPGTATPFIGRDHELSLLAGLFERVVREQAPHLVTLSGEPGVGKSRLLREFRTHVDDLPDLVRWRQGRCLPYGEGITFWALGEIVKSHAGILENDGAEEAAAKLGLAVDALAFEEPEEDWIRARLAPLVGVGEEVAAEREESFAAWRSFLEAIAAHDPFVLVIEDLHWADPAMLAFVEHVAEWASGVPLLVVCTARPELFDREPGWGGGKRNHTAVSLSPLSERETAELIAALLDQTVLPAETQSELLSRAGGNPLYAEEFIRMLIDRGFLARRGASWSLTASEIPVPENVQALIAARLDTLPSERKAMLQDAAVLGKVFWSGAVAEMRGLPDRQVRDDLHELARKELLRPARRSSVEGEAEYAFQHLLIRDVAYAQIPRAARAAKHRGAAAWIERMAGERVADNAELLAYHYEQALELVRATGEDPSELEAQARRFLLMAAERAAMLDATRVKDHLRRALVMTRPGQSERLQVLLSGLRGWMFTGETDDSLALEALEEARLQGDELGEGQALAVLSYISWARGDTSRQAELIESSLRILERHPPGPELAFAYTRAAAAAGLAGRASDSHRLIERSLPVVREFGDDVGFSILMQFRGEARIELFGEVEDGLADFREGIRLALDSAPAGIVVAAHINLGDAIWFEKGPEEGLALYREASDIGDRRGAVANANWARMESMWPLFDLGRWDELLEVGDRLMADMSDRTMQIAVLTESYRQLVLVNRGSLEGVDAIEEQILPRAREIGDGQVVSPAFRLGAMARFAAGDRVGAVALVEEAGALLRERPGFRGILLDDSARICLAAGEPAVLRALLADLVPHVTRDRHSTISAQANLAELEADLASALLLYEEVAEGWGAFPHVLEHGHALAGAGRCLLGLGREAGARERLSDARERFVALGAGPLVAETDELLARATAKTS